MRWKLREKHECTLSPQHQLALEIHIPCANPGSGAACREPVAHSEQPLSLMMTYKLTWGDFLEPQLHDNNRLCFPTPPHPELTCKSHNVLCHFTILESSYPSFYAWFNHHLFRKDGLYKTAANHTPTICS